MNLIHHRLDPGRWERLPAARIPVRSVPEGDHAGVVTLATRCRGHAGFGDTVSWRGLAGMLSTAGGRLAVSWVAEERGVPVGAVGLVGVPLAAEIRWSIPFLLVDPSVRRSGVATGLVREALREAAAHQAGEVTAATRRDWAAADGFWRSITSRLAD